MTGDRFPASFLFGAATAAYQIEGAHDEDGKGPSIWDVFAHTPGRISDRSTGDVACDHYHRFREDVALMADLGLDAYRFSISWPRVLPDGDGAVNSRGLDFYERLVEELLDNGIEPFVTLYHWDLPLALQERGGWCARETIGRFADFAAIVSRRLGDRVHTWITLNEPQVAAFAGHASGEHAPGLRDLGLALRAAHHLLLAHREASRALRSSASGARVGIACNLAPVHPARDSSDDVAAARLEDGYANRWFLDPLFGRGYPLDVLERRGERLPAGAVEEMHSYAGALDFLGVNYYSRRVVGSGGDTVRPVGATFTSMGWEVYPAGLRELLLRMHRDYAPRALYVTENGATFEDELVDGRVDDPARAAFLEAHVEQCDAALAAGVPLGGYFVWSLIDNFEWAHGYTKRFGIVYVDYPTQRRILKESGLAYHRMLAAR